MRDNKWRNMRASSRRTEMLMQESSSLSSGSYHGSSPRTSPTDLDLSDIISRYRMDPKLKEEIARFTEEKKRLTMNESDEEGWRSTIKRELEKELDRRVREALETPPGQKDEAEEKCGGETNLQHLERLNSHIQLDLTDKEKDYMKNKKWKVIQAKRRIRRLMAQSQFEYDQSMLDRDLEGGSTLNRYLLTEQYGQSNCEYNGLFGMQAGFMEGAKSHSYYAKVTDKAMHDFGNLSAAERHEFFYAFTKNGFKEAMRTGKLPDGSEMESLGNGKFRDKYGIVRDRHGPFWPPDHGPLFPAQEHSTSVEPKHEVLAKIFEVIIAEPRYGHKDLGTEVIKRGYSERSARTVDNQQTPYTNKWRGIQIVYDSEKSCKDYEPPHVSEGNCPSLTFESRFESGNLRQARRIGQFEYELVLKCDLYTKRHTQWYYFRVNNAQPNITYKFRIINLLKRDSLYNHGMKPILYSEKNANLKNLGWSRSGHHICYSRNTNNLQCPLLSRDRAYYMLEWQMEFPNANDVYYLAHCYPYTFTDLRDDLDSLLADPERSKVMQREVLCETRAGNSCFLVTVSDFEPGEKNKKAIVVSARVHPGETNSSWMMKGLFEYITGSSHTAKELRRRFVFKIVPMLNPDGVIVGNYRCSLAARDLNRNYRHPRKESFPTVYHLKLMMEEVSKTNEIMLYCDLHGHSRKHNVFMYGCNTDPNRAVLGASMISETYLKERLFPWLMSQKAPDKFSFRGCKFQIKRCKESTGRVVMFRQLKILNSFTMEATFCGTSICKGDRRHFNTNDFRTMGHAFCEVCLEFDHIQEDRARQSEVVLDLTRAITHQILETRGLLPPNLPDFSTEAGRDQLKVYTSDGKCSNSEQVATAFANMINKEVLSGKDAEKKSQKEAKDTKDSEQLPSFLTTDVNQLLDQMSTQTIEGCVQLLQGMNVQESEVESDSSDSDSESDPEMKYTDPPRVRRKKKKNKKKKDEVRKDDKKHEVHSAPHRGGGGSANDNSLRPKSMAALPAIGKGDESQKQANKVNSEMNRLVKTYVKQPPGFVNKYANRSNGGIPCFSEERLLERAAKRMTEMKKRMEEEQQRRETMFYPGSDEESHGGGAAPRGYPFPPANKLQSASELKTHFHQAFQQAGPVHIRTGYMHAADEGGSLHDVSQPGLYGPTADSLDSDSDDPEEYTQRIPLTAMRNPYANVGSGGVQQSQPFLRPIPHRIGRLPALSMKPFADSCSIPLRHTNQGMSHGLQLASSYAPQVETKPGGVLAENPVVGARTHRTDRKHPTPVLHEKHPHEQRSMSRRSVESDVTHNSTMFLSREYTDLILSRLRNNKTNATSTFPAQHPAKLTMVQRKVGERHSTCE